MKFPHNNLHHWLIQYIFLSDSYLKWRFSILSKWNSFFSSWENFVNEFVFTKIIAIPSTICSGPYQSINHIIWNIQEKWNLWFHYSHQDKIKRWYDIYLTFLAFLTIRLILGNWQDWPKSDKFSYLINKTD